MAKSASYGRGPMGAYPGDYSMIGKPSSSVFINITRLLKNVHDISFNGYISVTTANFNKLLNYCVTITIAVKLKR